MANLQLEQFIRENSSSLKKLSNMNYTEIECVLTEIDELRKYFTQSTEKLKELPRKEGLKEEVELNITLAYSGYDEAINCLKLFDEESALYYAHLAGGHILNAKENGYRLVGYDFLIFLLVGFLAFKFGLFGTAEFFFAHLDEYNVLSGSLEKVRELCRSTIEMLIKFKECDDGPFVHTWLTYMVSYWFFVSEKPGRIDNENMLKGSKNLYDKYLKRNVPQHLKKAIMSDIMRYEFGCLIIFLQSRTLMRDRHGRLICKVKGDKAVREIGEKLNSLDTYLRGVKVTEENVNDCGCYGFLILLTCGVSYQLIRDYHAAVQCFQKAGVVLAALKSPFKGFFEQINFGKFESYCKTMLPTVSSLDTFVVEDVVENTIKEASIDEIPNDERVDEGVIKEKYGDEVNEAIGKVVVNKEKHEDESKAIENVIVVEDDEENKDESKAHLRFDWIIRDWVENKFENDYSFANVTRSIFGGVDGVDSGGDGSDDETEDEEGLMIRYRDLSKAKKERRMLKKIENLCPEGGQFVLRANSPIYKQMVKKDGVEVPVYDFVVEHGIPFATWLERRSKEFDEQVKDGSKAEWWKFIKADVKRIFRGVIRGLWVLSSLGYSCLGLNGMGIFVCNSQGKIKPCAEDEGFKMWKEGNGNVRDVKDLREVLYSIIVYPFHSNADVKVDAIVKMGFRSEPIPYFLDLEMRLVFEQIQKFLSNVLNFDSIIDASFFWTKEERVGFLFKFAELVERSLLPHGIDSCITFREDWHSKINGLKNSSGQFSNGEESVLHTLFWSKRCERYSTSLDVVRYAVDVIKHYNSKEYDSLRPSILKDVEIESLLRDHIPELYCVLVRSLTMGYCLPNLAWIHSGVCLKELLSRCFAKGECDSGCSPYMMCDHLLV